MTGTSTGARPPQHHRPQGSLAESGGNTGSSRQPGGVPNFLGAPATGPARWVLALAVLGAVMGTSLGLGSVLLGNSWLPQAFLVTAMTLLLPALTRRYPRLNPVAPIAALLGWIMGLTLAFFPGTAYLGFIPSPQTVDAAVELTTEAATRILVSNTPVPTDDGIAFVICAGLGFAALLIDTLAITVALPAASAIGLVLILLPAALTTQDGIGAAGLVGAATGYLLILGCCRWYAPEGQLRAAANRAASGTLTRAAGLGAAVVLVMMLASALVPGFSAGSFPQGSRLGSPGNVSGLDPMISLGNDLRSQSTAINMTYLTSAPGPLYLRMSTLEDFSGKTWKPSPVPVGLSGTLSGLQPAPGPNPAVPQTLTTTLVSVLDLSSTWLPAPLSVENVDSLRGQWTWDPSTQTITGNATTAEQSYTVTSRMPDLTPELLSAANQKPDSRLDPVFTKLPNNVPAIIKTTAEKVTEGQSSTYGRALAIQDYLRSGTFTYSVKTPVQEGYDGAGMNVLATFLEVKSGYCVHFSAAMAVMARELGIPSRIAVGYAPGQATQTTDTLDGLDLRGYQVAGRDAHAWPELYFEGLGWVPFEPTPSRGDVPSYAQEVTASNPRPNNNDLLNGSNSRPSAPAPETPSTAATSSAAATPVPATPEPARIGAGFMAAALVLVLLASPAFTRVLVRRRRLALVRGAASGRAASGRAGTGGDRTDPRDGPESLAWRELLAGAVDYGYRFDPSLTPALQGARMAALLGDGGTRDVDLVRSAYEQVVYGPTASGTPAGRDDLADALERIGAQLTGRATTPARIRAALLPPSLFSNRR
ncbi:DUF3488 and transglutaminase-like domain-containing protein [Arthrobacter alpinus]|uniref:DUF3488 and transglutaminase-like domain-containing protein n=1 Tax=Arthrobacter alpinus TaxID=656366 RepID=UPI001648C436|nr:DUF3488 and transglutaminase-like domain-containing protein [Arthrobacter alpinus]